MQVLCSGYENGYHIEKDFVNIYAWLQKDVGGTNIDLCSNQIYDSHLRYLILEGSAKIRQTISSSYNFIQLK